MLIKIVHSREGSQSRHDQYIPAWPGGEGILVNRSWVGHF